MVDTGPGYAPDLSRVDPEKLDAFKQALSEGDRAAMRSIAGEIGAAVSPSYGHRKEELRWNVRARLTMLGTVPFLLLDKLDGQRVVGIAGIVIVIAVVVWMIFRMWKCHRAYVRACREEGVPTELGRFLGRSHRQRQQ